MQSAINKLIKTLTNKGYRITKARREIIEALMHSKRPQTIQDLVTAVSADEASVYRTVHLLKKTGLIEEIVLKDERPRYAVAHGHHHHAVCTDCGRVAHIACQPELATPELVPGFKSIESHEITYYGLCSQCC